MRHGWTMGVGRLAGLLCCLALVLTGCDARDVLEVLNGPPTQERAAAADSAPDPTPAAEEAAEAEAAAAKARKRRERKRAERAERKAAQQREAQQAADSTPAPSGGASSAGLSGIESRIFELLNATRRDRGLAALSVSGEISSGARAWSCQMATSGNFRHADLRSAGVNGENIAWGQRSASEVHNGWMNSPGHRDNRISSRWSSYGVGVCANGDGSLYFTERFR